MTDCSVPGKLPEGVDSSEDMPGKLPCISQLPQRTSRSLHLPPSPPGLPAASQGCLMLGVASAGDLPGEPGLPAM